MNTPFENTRHDGICAIPTADVVEDTPTDGCFTDERFTEEVIRFIVENPHDPHVVITNRVRTRYRIVKELALYCSALDDKVAMGTFFSFEDDLVKLRDGIFKVLICSKDLGLTGWRTRGFLTIGLSATSVLSESAAIQFAGRARDAEAKYFIRYIADAHGAAADAPAARQTSREQGPLPHQWQEINSMPDTSVDAWLAYYLGYSKIGMLMDTLYACDPHDGAWSPLSFHLGDAGTQLIDQRQPTMTPERVGSPDYGWVATIENDSEQRVGRGPTHRHAALRLILQLLACTDLMPSLIPPPRKV